MFLGLSEWIRTCKCAMHYLGRCIRQLVTGLEDFGDKPDASNEKILENIQMAWYEEKK